MRAGRGPGTRASPSGGHEKRGDSENTDCSRWASGSIRPVDTSSTTRDAEPGLPTRLLEPDGEHHDHDHPRPDPAHIWRGCSFATASMIHAGDPTPHAWSPMRVTMVRRYPVAALPANRQDQPLGGEPDSIADQPPRGERLAELDRRPRSSHFDTLRPRRRRRDRSLGREAGSRSPADRTRETTSSTVPGTADRRR